MHVVPADVSTCYRHPDRRAGVRCQRCDRTICPSCMSQASVGFHCPECVRSSSQRVVTARSLNSGTPVVTAGLIALNVAIYIMSTVAERGAALVDPSPSFTLDWGTIGELRVATPAGIESVGVAEGEWYRLLTGGFLHGSLLHIAFNMFALYILGQSLERMLGGVRFAAVYVSSLLAGSLGVLLLDPQSVTVGASGAVFGLFGYVLVAQLSRGINPMSSGIGGIVVLNLLFTFTVPGISVGGHLGGLIGGAVIGAIADVAQPKLRLPAPATTAFIVAFGLACAGGAIALV